MGAATGEQPANLSVLAPGARFNGAYEIVRCIKSGGMGAVYEVLQTNTKRRRALKVMLPSIVSDPEMRDRFKLEATVAADIDSEHIVETLDAGVDAETGMPFIVMELLKGQELSALIREVGPIARAEATAMLLQIARALDKTHAQGIIHRDLKPENIFVTKRDDGSPRLKVLDFGVAKIVADNTAVVDATRSVGSPLYMAPEQIKGDQRLTPRADLYALAHIAFAMLVGSAYWVTERRATDGLYGFLLRVVEGTTAPAVARAAERGVTLPGSFNAWFTKATALAPQDRYESATSMVAALADALDVPSAAIDASTSQRFPTRAAAPEPSDESATIPLDITTNVGVIPSDSPRKSAMSAAPTSGSAALATHAPLSDATAKKPPYVWIAVAVIGTAVGIGAALATRGGGDDKGAAARDGSLAGAEVSPRTAAAAGGEKAATTSEPPPTVTPALSASASAAATASTTAASATADQRAGAPRPPSSAPAEASKTKTDPAPKPKATGKTNPLDEY